MFVEALDSTEIRRRCSILRSKVKLVSVISAATILVGSMALPASAAPASSSSQAEFNRVKAQIEQIDQQLDVVVEEYNSAALNLSKIQRELKVYNDKINIAEKEAAGRQAAINKRFASIYREGGLSYLEVLINTRSIDQFLYYLALVERLTSQDARIIAELEESKKEIAAQREAILEKEKKQKAVVAEVKTKKDKITSQLRERNRLLASIKDAMSRQQASDNRRQAQLQNNLKLSYKPRPGVAVSRGGSRSNVVGLAMDELGKPYRWGASGPGSFDCSGLTRYVYGKTGVSLPHSSRAQYGSGQHVSRAELQPGDLVFFARGGTISHVGIYVGGDNFIHAPQTGDVVKISSISAHGGYVGATRP